MVFNAVLKDEIKTLDHPVEDAPSIGHIICINRSRVYGFLVEQCSMESIFFHKANCVTPFELLKPGNTVKIVTKKASDGRFYATEVEKMSRNGGFRNV